MKIICYIKEIWYSMQSMINTGFPTSGCSYVEQEDGSLKCEVCGNISN